MPKLKIFCGQGMVAGRQYPMAMRSTSAAKVAAALNNNAQGRTSVAYVRTYWSCIESNAKLDAALDRFPPETLIMCRAQWSDSPDDWQEIP